MYGKCNKCDSHKRGCDPCKKSCDPCKKSCDSCKKDKSSKNEYGYGYHDCKPEPCCRPSCGCKGSRVILSSSGRTYFEKQRCKKHYH